MATEIDTLPHLRGLLEVQRLVRAPEDLPVLFAAIARTIADALGFGTVAINVYRRAFDDFEVVTVHGSSAARDALLGKTTLWSSWEQYFDPRFLQRGAYLIPHDQVDWNDFAAHIPDFEAGTEPDSWHPEDALMVPLKGDDGRVLGVVSVDEPESGRLPSDDELDLLVTLTGHVASAVETAQRSLEAARDRASLSQLLAISSRLTDLDNVDSVLDAVAAGIRDALEFDKVVIAVADGNGRFVPRRRAGWKAGDPALDFVLTSEDLTAITTPEFEVEGCFLIPWAEANRRAGSGSSYASVRNGRGPHAWNRHWLMIPLYERDGTTSGFIWVDDPKDCLIPSLQRLQALRTFANQAAAAVRAARDYSTLFRRNSELATLHRTTLGLLEGLDLDAVLSTIVDSARSLVGTPHGYLYLVDGDELVLRVKLGAFADAGTARVKRGEGVSGRVWESGRTYGVDDYDSWAYAIDEHRKVRLSAVLGVPLRAGGEIRGVFGVAFEEEGRSFNHSETALLERFAQLASLALENARLYDEVRAKEERNRRVLDNTHELISLVDLDGRIVYANPAHERSLGYSAEEMVGQLATAFAHPADPPLDLLGLPPLANVRIRRKDGTWALLELSIVLLRNQAGDPELMLGFGRDVSEQSRLEEQLRQAQKMESIGRLAGGIAHDFNNLLTAIGGYAELALLDLEPGTARESVEQIARASSRAAELTSQLLAFSRKQVLRPAELDLNEIVTDMASMLSRMLGESVVLSTALEPELGHTHADPTQVEQVVLNLAINARDAMHGGGNLSIRTANLDLTDAEQPPHPDLVPGAYVTLIVRDDGVGMDADTVDQIFEPFFTTKSVGQGTGLGLATVHGIVSQSGGAIWVESEPGRGTSFTVCLPRVARAA